MAAGSESDPITSLAQEALDRLFAAMDPRFSGLAANGGTEEEMPTAHCDTIDRLTAQSSGAFGNPSMPLDLATLLTDSKLGTFTGVLILPESVRLALGAFAYRPGHIDSQTLYSNQASILEAVGTGRCRQMSSWLLCHLNEKIAESDDPIIKDGTRAAYCSFTGKDHAFIVLLQREVTPAGESKFSPILYLDPWQAAMQKTAEIRSKHAGRRPFKSYKDMLKGLQQRPCVSAIGNTAPKRDPYCYYILAIGGGPSGLRTCMTPETNNIGTTPDQDRFIQFACTHVLGQKVATTWCKVTQDRRTGNQKLHFLKGNTFPRTLRPYNPAALTDLLLSAPRGVSQISIRSIGGTPAPYGYSEHALKRLIDEQVSGAAASGGGGSADEAAKPKGSSSARAPAEPVSAAAASGGGGSADEAAKPATAKTENPCTWLVYQTLKLCGLYSEEDTRPKRD